MSEVHTRLEQLMSILNTFERWNGAMLEFLNHNSEMSGQNKVLSKIVQEMTMLALNARIEAVHASESGKGFAVVADRVGQLATTARESSMDLGNSLNKNNVLATTTFQDIEASSRMMITIIRNLDVAVKELISNSD